MTNKRTAKRQSGVVVPLSSLTWEQRLLVRVLDGRPTPHDKKILAARERKWKTEQKKKRIS